VRAGIELLDSLHAFNKLDDIHSLRFGIRCGINSGYVLADPQTALGQIISVVLDAAATLRKQATTNGLVISTGVLQEIADKAIFRRTTAADSALDAWVYAPRSSIDDASNVAGRTGDRSRYEISAPDAFERLCQQLLVAMGYEATLSGGPGNEGVDILAAQPGNPGGQLVAVQCKYSNRLLGSEAVRSMVGTVALSGASEGWLIASSGFTASTRDAAVRMGIRLIDGTELEQLLRRYLPEALNVLAKRGIHIVRQPPSTAAGPAEPQLDRGSIAAMVQLINQSGKAFETTPGTYGKLEEEDLRNIILGHLNAVFTLGPSIGDTFSRGGKTDILLRVPGGALLIVECKFWGGAKLYQATIDQLFRYVSWRHTNGIIVTFSRTENLERVVAEANRATEDHPTYRRGLPDQTLTYRTTLHAHPADSPKNIEVHHLFFDLHELGGT
jgi:hypothetical protein